MVAEGLGSGGYRRSYLRSRLCLSLHVSWAPRCLGHSDVCRWCLELVLVLPFVVLQWWLCLYQSLFYLNTKHETLS
jgi:hypothetical protein